MRRCALGLVTSALVLGCGGKEEARKAPETAAAAMQAALTTTSSPPAGQTECLAAGPFELPRTTAKPNERTETFSVPASGGIYTLVVDTDH